MLHHRRKRQESLAAREAAGESFWSDKFDKAARTKIVLAFQTATENSQPFGEVARFSILRDEGLLYLAASGLSPTDDLLNYLLACPDEMVPTVIEAMSQVCSNQSVMVRTGVWNSPGYFDRTVSVVLREHRISYELIDNQMVEFSSRELHQEVVVPALQLLAGRPDLAQAESAYQAALTQITKGEPSNAITDAGTALQEMLLALGCVGQLSRPAHKVSP